MRAVWYEGGGPAAEVLQIGELEPPQPGEGEVRVKVAYSSVNPFDIKKRVHGAELAYWDRVVPHVDGSGEIESVGGGVSESRVGERVWLFGGIFVLSRKRLSTLFEQVNRVAVAPGFEFRIGAEISLDEVATLHQRVEGGAVPGAALIRI